MYFLSNFIYLNNFYMMKNLLFLSSALLFSTISLAQNVGINASGAAPAASAMLDIVATDKGLLVPRVALTALNLAGPIISPATSLLVYNTATAGVAPNNVTPGYYFWDGVKWVSFGGSGGKDWSILGNSGTVVSTNFLGTTDAVDFAIRTNNTERMRVLSAGQIGVNTTAPAAGDNVAIYSTATNNWALNCYNTQSSGSGVYVNNSNTTNLYSAIEANQASSNGAGVYGISTGATGGNGVLGQYNGASANGIGVSGRYNGTATTGIRMGVYGYAGASSGNQNIGVAGNYNSAAAWGIGVYGVAAGGGYVTGNVDIAVVGWRANNSAYSGYFNGNHVIANGTKSASVPTTKGNQLLYCAESPEVWFEDLGGGKLINGEATVQLDALFLETVVIDAQHPMRVFIQMEGESQEVFVTKGTTSFTVKERNNGNSNAEFSYRVMAKRIHFQDHRFGNDPVWGPGDTRKYSEYATPPAIDYDENVKLEESKKRNWKKTPMPEGFIYYDEIQNEAKSRNASKTDGK